MAISGPIPAELRALIKPLVSEICRPQNLRALQRLDQQARLAFVKQLTAAQCTGNPLLCETQIVTILRNLELKGSLAPAQQQATTQLQAATTALATPALATPAQQPVPAKTQSRLGKLWSTCKSALPRLARPVVSGAVGCVTYLLTKPKTIAGTGAALFTAYTITELVTAGFFKKTQNKPQQLTPAQAPLVQTQSQSNFSLRKAVKQCLTLPLTICKHIVTFPLKLCAHTLLLGHKLFKALPLPMRSAVVGLGVAAALGTLYIVCPNVLVGVALNLVILPSILPANMLGTINTINKYVGTYTLLNTFAYSTYQLITGYEPDFNSVMPPTPLWTERTAIEAPAQRMALDVNSYLVQPAIRLCGTNGAFWGVAAGAGILYYRDQVTKQRLAQQKLAQENQENQAQVAIVAPQPQAVI